MKDAGSRPTGLCFLVDFSMVTRFCIHYFTVKDDSRCFLAYVHMLFLMKAGIEESYFYEGKIKLGR